EGVDRAVAEIADEERVVEVAEPLEGRPGHAPGRVELSAAGKALEQMPGGVEDVDESISRAGDVVLLVGVLLGVGHVEMTVDGRDAEGGKAGGNLRVLESAGRVD